MYQLEDRQAERKNSFLLNLLVYLGPQQTGRGPLTLGKATRFPRNSHSTAKLTQRTLTGTLRNNT